MDHAAMVMVLQAFRDVNAELRAIRRAVDELTQKVEQQAEHARAVQSPAPRRIPFPRPVPHQGVGKP